MVLPASAVNELILNIQQEIHVEASIETTFDALLEQLGPKNENHEGKPMPMKLEARPGGRWFRDLGNDQGHLWAHVQAIRRPDLLEFSGPLMMSFPAVNNVQYRLAADKGGTKITFRHSGMGPIPDEFREGMPKGWAHMLEIARRAAEKDARGK